MRHAGQAYAAVAPPRGAVRLAKLLAQRGLCSRRQAEQWIVAGRVRVNGKVHTSLAEPVDPGVDRIEIDGRPLPARPPQVYILLNKPRFVLSTVKDERGRPTVLDLLPTGLPRLYPVGRLDWDSEGLLLLTNDGRLAQALMHPSHETEKVYDVEVDRPLTARALDSWRQGILLEDGPTQPVQVERLGERRFRIRLHEGRNRQIRRMCAALGYEVRRLVRVAEGPLQLAGLPPGQWRPLRPDEVRRLREETGV
ncbi:MAG: rRNA pseudouridine synthase [Limnochordaceae bacterium]|nr:rRNA pseudouridine synthase [Limnochordaceae bacterium]